MADRVDIGDEYRVHPPSGYVSEQKRANTEPGALREILEAKMSEGYVEIPVLQLLDEPTDQQFVYINNLGKYCSGGWLRFPRDEEKKEDCHISAWVLYSARNRSIVSLQLKENPDSPWAVRVWIKRELVRYRRPTVVTKWPVVLRDLNGVNQVVYYGSRREKAARFMSTGKFERAQRYGWVFEG